MTTKLYNINFPVPYYNQNTSPWAGLPLCGSTFAWCGCAYTAAAMLISYLRNDSSITPSSTYSAGGGQCDMPWSTVTSNWGLSCQRDPSSGSSSFDILKHGMLSLLNSSLLPFIVYIASDAGSNPAHSHYVVVKGFYGELPLIQDSSAGWQPDTNQITASMFLVNDPGSSNYVTLQDSINYYLNRYGTNMYVYNKRKFS